MQRYTNFSNIKAKSNETLSLFCVFHASAPFALDSESFAEDAQDIAAGAERTDGFEREFWRVALARENGQTLSLGPFADRFALSSANDCKNAQKDSISSFLTRHCFFFIYC